MPNETEITGVLVDLAGVVYEGDDAIPGAADAIAKLQDADLAVRFLTNTTRKTRADLLDKLARLGLKLDPDQVFTAPIAAKQRLQQLGLRPHLLIHPDLQPEFEGMDTASPNAVVVGDAGDAFTYEAMNAALNVLVDNANLIAMGDSRYFKDGDRLALDMGPFAHALTYATGVEPTVVGKPAAAFFEQALASIRCKSERCVMIGDDLRSDVGGAQAAGITGVLVRTGKFRPEDESADNVRPDHVVDDLAAAVDWVLQRA